jgi:hypothetical protein
VSTQLQPHRGATRRAWVATLFIPVGFVLSMVVGEGLFAMLVGAVIGAGFVLLNLVGLMGRVLGL